MFSTHISASCLRSNSLLNNSKLRSAKLFGCWLAAGSNPSLSGFFIGWVRKPQRGSGIWHNVWQNPFDSFAGKSGPVPVGQISVQKRNGIPVGCSVYLGVDSNGQKLRRFFEHLPAAEKFVNSHKTSPLPVGEDKRRTGPIIGSNWRMMLRSAIRSSRIDYRQNSIRHSFCSYAIAAGWPLADVIAYMGHGGSPSMIHSHYLPSSTSSESPRRSNRSRQSY